MTPSVAAALGFLLLLNGNLRRDQSCAGLVGHPGSAMAAGPASGQAVDRADGPVERQRHDADPARGAQAGAYLLFYRDTTSTAPDAALFSGVFLFQQAFQQFDMGFAAALACCWRLRRRHQLHQRVRRVRQPLRQGPGRCPPRSLKHSQRHDELLGGVRAHLPSDAVTAAAAEPHVVRASSLVDLSGGRVAKEAHPRGVVAAGANPRPSRTTYCSAAGSSADAPKSAGRDQPASIAAAVVTSINGP